MTRFFIALPLLLLAADVAASVRVPIAPPPPARIEVVTETVHGVETRDPYRWMEATDGKAFKLWFDAQQRYAKSLLEQAGDTSSLAEAISDALQSLPTLGQVSPTMGTVLITRWLEQGQALYALDDGATQERLVIDHEALEAAGRGGRIRRVTPSWDGRYAAITTTGRGDVAPQVSVVELSTGKLLPDRITDLLTTTSGSRYQVTWLPDSSGFVYPRLAEGAMIGPSGARYARGRQVLHRLGSPVSEDVAVFGHGVHAVIHTEDDDLPSAIVMAPGSSWIVARLARTRAERAELWAARLDDALTGKPVWQRIAEDGYGSPLLQGDRVLALTSIGADRRRIVARDLGAQASDWITVVPEREGLLREFLLDGEQLYFTELRDLRDGLYRADLDGKNVSPVSLPLAGMARFATASARKDGPWVELSNWIDPGSWYRVAPAAKQAEPSAIAPGGRFVAPTDLIVEQLLIPADDGVNIPVSVIRPRGIPLDGSAPLLLEAYGSFGKVQAPEFNPFIALWARQGAIFAYAHVRGNGELGEAWHRAALRENKSRATQDLLSVARGLVARGYTKPQRTILLGTSNGAQPAGMALALAPQQFGAVVYNVGQPDDLRGAKLDPTSARNLGEFGDTHTPEGVRLLLRNSPYYQLPEKISLPVLVVKSAPDDYNYGSSATIAKYVARLQAANSGDKPVLWLEQLGGHTWLFDGNPEPDAQLLAWLLQQVRAQP
ncbi:prolyl oligopeptidase family serine peptidase [Arenimonas sp.]|uniref:prolyl oligopeptidase family serine peptidase n=1 Tax=Arenimonas sp. TaxID=1872635 RepID=UPI0039E5D11F